MSGGARQGKQGGSTNGVEYSPDKLKRIKAQRSRTEARWAAKAGPVEVRRICTCLSGCGRDCYGDDGQMAHCSGCGHRRAEP